MSIPPSKTIKASLGTGFIGSLVIAAVYGIICNQTYTFFRMSHDPRSLKLLIIVVWCIDTLDTIFVAHAVYHYCIISPENGLSVFISPVWSLMAQTLVATYSDVIVQSVYARRIWLLCGRNFYLLGYILSFTAMEFVCSHIFVAQIIANNSFPTTPRAMAVFYIGLAAGVLAHLAIAGLLCIILVRLRTGFPPTDSLLGTFMMYAINTGLLTSFCLIGTIISFAVHPAIPVYLPMFFLMSKVNFSSLLAALNNRQAIWERCFGNGIISIQTNRSAKNEENPVIIVNIEQSVSRSGAVVRKNQNLP